MESIQARAEPGTPDKLGAPGDGVEVDDRPHVQRLHIEL